MNYKKIIPCLDIKDGRVVKGINFVDFKDAGDPAEVAQKYCQMGADEVVFLDISATVENRKTMHSVIKRAAANVSIPLTVGGGIKTIEDMQAIFDCGANKISINSVAVNNPQIIKEAALAFGSDKIVVAIDVKRGENGCEVYINGGTKNTHIDAVAWAKQAESLGAGEILLTSMDFDGTKAGYDLEITKQIANSVNIPVVASGGAGTMQDFLNVLTVAGAQGALAASLFHFGEIDICELKEFLINNNVKVMV